MIDARSEILARIATALGRPGRQFPVLSPAAVVAPIERRYRGASGLSGPGYTLAGVFAERVADYGAQVHMVDAGEIAGTVSRCAGDGRVLVPSGLRQAWLAGLSEAATDDPTRSAQELDSFDCAVTACAVAISQTGTIVLDHRPDQGRRALTLIPDHHICVVVDHQIVVDVPQAIAALDPRRPLTWISGPSATSDIELERVVGVHGPRRLDVIILRTG